jgi:hypothetical protein
MAIVTACVKKALATGLVAVSFMVSANAFAQGAEYNYLLHCGGCHIEDGSGLPPHVPDLRVEMPLFAGFTEGRAYIARVPGVIQAPMDSQHLKDLICSRSLLKRSRCISRKSYWIPRNCAIYFWRKSLVCPKAVTT